MASRSLTDLDNPMMERAIKFDEECAREGLDILIYCTLRDFEEQAELYRNGRSYQKILQKHKQLEKLGRSDLAEILLDVGPQRGKHVVTNAGPGQSYHNYGMAFDACPLRNGKPVWGASASEDKKLWNQYGEIAESVGLEWSGRWKRFKEMPHCQLPGQNWRELIKQ